VLRLRAMLRRTPPGAISDAPIGPIRLGKLEFDTTRGELRGVANAGAAAATVHLTGSEAALLGLLAGKCGQVFTREDIAAALDMDDAGERAIDVQVTRLRRKIEADPREPRFLHTVRGRGYVLKPGA
jgi:two-component system phosphate regulon response regulator OmpR